MKEKRIVLKHTDGSEDEYTLLMLFKSTKMNKEYILYTDETYDADDKLNIFASIYNDNTISDIETDEEWIEVENMLDKYINGVEND